MNYTRHFKQRAAQRGITPEMIDCVTDMITPIRKQGLLFYVVRRKDLPSYIRPELADKLIGLVIIATADGWALTCYKNRSAFKNIQKKPKRLS